MSKGQTLDVWLDKMKETNKGYENEINEMNTRTSIGRNLGSKSKRTLENYLETSSKKRFKTSSMIKRHYCNNNKV